MSLKYVPFSKTMDSLPKAPEIICLVGSIALLAVIIVL